MFAETIIIGAGAAGLACAARLSRRGVKVLVLEARDRIGGRIHTVHEPRVALPLELGAEFVHGAPPALLSRIPRRRRNLKDADGPHLYAGDGPARRADREFQRALALLPRAGAREEPMATFLEQEVGLTSTRGRLAAMFVEGFYATKLDQVSSGAIAAMARAAEDQGGDTLRRVLGGYTSVLEGLAATLPEGALRLGTVVEVVQWNAQGVTVHARTRTGLALPGLEARAVVVTLPLGVLQHRQGEGAVRFSPELPARPAIQALRMGAIVKLLLRFRSPFWRQARRRLLRDFGFLHDPTAAFPTLWRPLPSQAPVLVGWAAGPAGEALSGKPEQEVVLAALDGLARVFAVPRSTLEAQLEGWRVADWLRDPYSRGGYMWIPVGTVPAVEELARPVGPLHFAGEATVLGNAGTVHGALESGDRAATEVLAHRTR